MHRTAPECTVFSVMVQSLSKTLPGGAGYRPPPRNSVYPVSTMRPFDRCSTSQNVTSECVHLICLPEIWLPPMQCWMATCLEYLTAYGSP